MRKILFLSVVIIWSQAWSLFQPLLAAEADTNLVSWLLPDLMSPETILVDSHQVFIVDSPRILIYGKENMKLRRVIGSVGKGPDQFQAVPRRGIRLRAYIDEDRLVVNSHQRVSQFSKQGEFHWSKMPYDQTQYVIPFGNRFVVAYFYIHVGTGKSSKHILFFNKDLEFEKKITEGPLGSGSARGFGGPDRKMHVDEVPMFYHALTYKDQVYIVHNSEGLHIDVYNDDGDLQRMIRHDWKGPLIQDDYRDKRRNEIYDRYGAYRSSIVVDEVEQFPACKNVIIADDRIHVFTYDSTSDSVRVPVLNLEGDVISNKRLPKAKAYTIHNQIYYYLKKTGYGEWTLELEPIMLSNPKEF